MVSTRGCSRPIWSVAHHQRPVCGHGMTDATLSVVTRSKGINERYWDEQLETLSVERRRVVRDHRLRCQVRRCWDGSPFYHARLKNAGIEIAAFGGLSDLARIPIMHLSDLPSPEIDGDASKA